MKALKVIGVILLILIVLFFVVALFLPSKMHMESSMVIDRPASQIFKQVNNYRNWENWSPWMELDPDMSITYEGPELGKGASYAWISEVHGNGKMTITESKPYEYVTNELNFMNSGGPAYSNFYLSETEEGTQVLWTLDIPKLTYPVERYFGLLMPGMMKKFFNQGLENLAEVTSQMPEPVMVTQTTLPEMKVITVMDSCHWSEFEAKIGAMYGELIGYLASNKDVQVSGAPFTMYSKWDEANQFAVFEAGLPVNKEVSGKGSVIFKTIPESRVITATHFGRYDQIEPVYVALEEYMKEFGLQEACCPMEVYINDPSMEPDTAKWQTDVYFHVN